MSINIKVFVGTFLEVPDCKLEKLYKVSRCPACNVVLESPYCPKCGTAANPVVQTKLEPLDVYGFLEGNDICTDDFFIYTSDDNKTYIIDCGEVAGTWLDTESDCAVTPVVTENQLTPYLEFMQLFDDEKIPCTIITGAISYWR